MFQKCRKLLCIILAIAIVFSGIYYEGIYFESIKINSTIFNTSEQASVPCIYSNNAKIISGEVCTSEMLGISDRFYSRQLTESQISSRRESKLAVNTLWVDSSLQLLTNYFLDATGLQSPKSYSRAVLVTYIHNSDGKKRI